MDFGTVIWIVVLVFLPIAAVLFASAFGLLEQLGKGGLSIDEPPAHPAPTPGSAIAEAEREEEIRQLLQARHERQLARGEPAIDVEEELKRLLALDPAAPERKSAASEGDHALRQEVRQLVLARNERRIARGEAPLDVEAEIERQLRDVGTT